jgi:hypothetical protein
MNDPQVVLRIPEFVQKQTDSFKAADVSRAGSIFITAPMLEFFQYTVIGRHTLF